MGLTILAIVGVALVVAYGLGQRKSRKNTAETKAVEEGQLNAHPVALADRLEAMAAALEAQAANAVAMAEDAKRGTR